LGPLPYFTCTEFPQQFTDPFHRTATYTPRLMKFECRTRELWREREWRCERWIVDGRMQVRLYFDGHLMSELADGPRIDLQQQTDEWLTAVRADSAYT
jgi:hypothetical protein